MCQSVPYNLPSFPSVQLVSRGAALSTQRSLPTNFIVVVTLRQASILQLGAAESRVMLGA